MTSSSIDNTFEFLARTIVRLRWVVLVRAIGLGLAAGILMDTFLVRTLLVPATVILLGRWNWWPSAMARADEASRPETFAGGAADASEVPS